MAFRGTGRVHRRRSAYAGIFLRLGLLFAFVMIIGSWSLMLVVGMLHAWWTFIPSMGYGTALPLVIFPAIFGIVIKFVVTTVLDD